MLGLSAVGLVVAAALLGPDASAANLAPSAVLVVWWIDLPTAGAVVAHGLPLVLLDGQFVLALASDPFGRGWDLFGTADRAIDDSPLSPTWVGLAQIVLATTGAALATTGAALGRWHALGLPASSRGPRYGCCG